MRIRFYVIKSGQRIYSLEFPVDDYPSQFAEFASAAMSEFQATHNNVSVCDDDVTFGFERA
jgi:hypothetical protein